MRTSCLSQKCFVSLLPRSDNISMCSEDTHIALIKKEALTTSFDICMELFLFNNADRIGIAVFLFTETILVQRPGTPGV